MTFDVLIKNGIVIDGVSNEGIRADIGINGPAVKAIGNLRGSTARKEIAAEGKYVVPGFIDAQNHSDSYLTLLESPSLQSLITQGITTIAVGHCGTSLAPLVSPEALKSVQKWRSISGANLNWLKFSEYFEALSHYPLGVNVMSLVGHSTLRRGLLRDEVRPATPEEVQIMQRMLDESLQAGAGGLSLGLVYAHESDASGQELSALAKVTAKRQRMLSIHLRSEGAHVVEALDEAVALAKATEARLKVSHFKIQGKQNWAQLELAIVAVDRAYQSGVDVVFDVYPYPTTWSVLYTYLPKWAYEGGRDAIIKNLRDRSSRERILTYLKNQAQDLDSVLVATSEITTAFLGKTLGQIARNQEISVEEALLNVLSVTNAQVIVFDYNLSSSIVETLMKHPLSIIATDGAGYDLGYASLNGSLVHPRCFGAMPKFLAAVREKNLMSWPVAIKKITSRPAEKLGIKKRGALVVGNYADVVVLDPRAVGSRASYENPYIQSEGIDKVILNGRQVVSGGQLMGIQAGQILRF